MKNKCSVALTSLILSALLDAPKGTIPPPKTLIFVFTLSKSVPSICLCHRELRPLLHSHATTQPSHARGQGSLPEAGRQSHSAGEKGPDPLLPVERQIAICTAEILILLSKHIWRFLASVVWLTAPVLKGSVLCTLNVRLQPANCLSVHRLRSEWRADVGGWKRGGRESRGKCCLRNQRISSGLAGSGKMHHSSILGKRSEHQQAHANHLKLPRPHPRWNKQASLSALVEGNVVLPQSLSPTPPSQHPPSLTLWLFNTQEMKSDSRKAKTSRWGCTELSVWGLNSTQWEKAQCFRRYWSSHASWHGVPWGWMSCTAD